MVYCPQKPIIRVLVDRAGISENYMFSATAVRLRELSIAYNIPVHVKGIIQSDVYL